jgi:hypothetical protein
MLLDKGYAHHIYDRIPWKWIVMINPVWCLDSSNQLLNIQYRRDYCWESMFNSGSAHFQKK